MTDLLWWGDVEPAPRPEKTWTDAQGRTWVRKAEPQPTDQIIENRDGVWWHSAPLPPRWHRCAPQTRAWTGPQGLTYTERCACGATRHSLTSPWTSKNETRNRRRVR